MKLMPNEPKPPASEQKVDKGKRKDGGELY